jgi:1-deoxyxylulose-5-phosphate synthase
VQYARLGSSGLRVSRIALGMMSYGSQAERKWHLGEDEAEPIVRRAVEAGVTFFDTADMYSDGASEEITGRLLAKFFSRRDDYVLARVALAWRLSKPAVTAPIVGATKPHHVEDAISAVDLTLSEDQVGRLEAPYRPHPVLGHHRRSDQRLRL